MISDYFSRIDWDTNILLFICSEVICRLLAILEKAAPGYVTLEISPTHEGLPEFRRLYMRPPFFTAGSFWKLLNILIIKELAQALLSPGLDQK